MCVGVVFMVIGVRLFSLVMLWCCVCRVGGCVVVMGVFVRI